MVVVGTTCGVVVGAAVVVVEVDVVGVAVLLLLLVVVVVTNHRNQIVISFDITTIVERSVMIQFQNHLFFLY